MDACSTSVPCLWQGGVYIGETFCNKTNKNALDNNKGVLALGDESQ